MENNSEKQKKKIPLALLILLIFSGTIVALGLLFCIWFFFPVQKASPSELLTRDSVGYFSFTFHPQKPGIQALKAKMKEAVASSEISSFKKSVAEIALSSFFPKYVSGIISVDKESSKPRITGILGTGNEIKFVPFLRDTLEEQLFAGSGAVKMKANGMDYTIRKQEEDESENSSEDQLPVEAYALIGRNICVAMSAEEMRNSIISYKEGYSAFPSLQTMAETITRDENEDYEGYFYMDNSDNGLSVMIQAVEDKFTFAAFPSINAVEHIKGFIELTPGDLTGTVTFAVRDTSQIEVIASDVKFFYQALRRLFKPQGLRLKGKIEVEKDTVLFNFTIKDFLDKLFNQFNKNEEE